MTHPRRQIDFSTFRNGQQPVVRDKTLVAPRAPTKDQAAAIQQGRQLAGKAQTMKGEDLVLREYVYSTLWKKVKFIRSDSELDFSGKLAQKVMRALNVAQDETIRKEYWCRSRNKIVKWINQKRNNTIGAVKKYFLKWAIPIIQETKTPPTIGMLKMYRLGEQNKFNLWADGFFQAGSGTVQFRVLRNKQVLSEILSVYDEAFIVAAVHNGFDRWMKEAVVIANDGTIEKKDLPPNRWTETGKTAKKYEGWTEDGIKFFNKQIEELFRIRDTDHSCDLELAYLEMKKGESQGRKMQKRTSFAVMAMNGLDDSDEERVEEPTRQKRKFAGLGSSYSDRRRSTDSSTTMQSTETEGSSESEETEGNVIGDGVDDEDDDDEGEEEYYN